MAGPCSSKHGPVPFTVLKNFLMWIIYSHLKPFKFKAGPRFPTTPVTAQRIFRRWGIISSWCYADCQQRSIDCLVVLPKHDPVHFTVFKNLFVWMVWSFSKTLELMARPCFPKHSPVPFTVLKNFFVWLFCRQVKTFKFMAGPRSPTSHVTAKFVSRRWKMFS